MFRVIAVQVFYIIVFAAFRSCGDSEDGDCQPPSGSPLPSPVESIPSATAMIQLSHPPPPRGTLPLEQDAPVQYLDSSDILETDSVSSK